MEAVFSPLKLKTFHKVIHALAKLNEYITLECWADRLNLSVISPSLAAFGLVSFQSGFFDSYSSATRSDANTIFPVCCKVHHKALSSALQLRGGHVKGLVRWSIQLVKEPPRLEVQLNWFPATMKTHSLFYEDACALHAKYPKLNLYPLQWSAPASILSEWLLPLEKAFVREEIIWTFELDRTLTLASPSEFGQAHSVRLDVDASDMRILANLRPVHVSFSLSELKAVVTLAEALDKPISGYLSEPGDPVVLQIGDEGLTIKIVISSAAPIDTRHQARSPQRQQETTDHPLSSSSLPSLASSSRGTFQRPTRAHSVTVPSGFASSPDSTFAAVHPAHSVAGSAPLSGRSSANSPSTSPSVLKRNTLFPFESSNILSYQSNAQDGNCARQPTLGMSSVDTSRVRESGLPMSLESILKSKKHGLEGVSSKDHDSDDDDDDLFLPPTPPKKQFHML